MRKIGAIYSGVLRCFFFFIFFMRGSINSINMIVGAKDEARMVPCTGGLSVFFLCFFIRGSSDSGCESFHTFGLRQAKARAEQDSHSRALFGKGSLPPPRRVARDRTGPGARLICSGACSPSLFAWPV